MLADYKNVLVDARSPQTFGDDDLKGIVLLNADGIICYLNTAWRHLLGARDADVLRVGNNYLEALAAIFVPENQTYMHAIERSLQMVLNGERESVVFEYPHERAGHWRWFLVQMQSQRVEGTRGVLIEQRDITHTMRVHAVGE